MTNLHTILEKAREEFFKTQFATCPTDTKEPFFWKWNDHGKERIEAALSNFAHTLLQAARDKGTPEKFFTNYEYDADYEKGWNDCRAEVDAKWKLFMGDNK